ncbi:MAG: iron uptake porin [Leptolyngbyaceae cyanobacterium bins.59]|nr:iron uptake porin [Leptolyngbyaceae cyanobacterium bins.59]
MSIHPFKAIRSSLFNLSLLCLFWSYSSPVVAKPEQNLTGMEALTGVDQLSDVRPTDWAFQAVQSLAERYGCLTGYLNGSFQGDRSLTRYEFAAGLNSCLDQVNQLILDNTGNRVSRSDLETLQRLQLEFASELATLQNRMEALEIRTRALEANQFTTTTKLTGQVIMVVNAGGFTGNELIDPKGTQIATSSPTPTTIYRVALDFNTSFIGTDLLRVRLGSASGGANDNAGAVLEPNFGSGLDFSSKPPSNGNFEITRLYYTFRPLSDLSVSIGPDIRVTDYVDLNRYANLGFRDFSTEALVNNYILFPISGPTTGAIIAWNPAKGPVTIRALYAAADAANPTNQGLLKGTAPFIRLLYPIQGNPATVNLGDRGLFGDTYQGLFEAEYTPWSNFTMRFQYSEGAVYNRAFQVFAVNTELTIAKNVGFVGRYGYSNYDDTTFGNLHPQYWMAGIVIQDAGIKGALAGFAVAQPFIESRIGNTTQTDFEAFYNVPVHDAIRLTPVLQVITNPSNQQVNGTIITGTLRAVFSF